MRQLTTGKSVDRRPVSFVFVFVLRSLLQDEPKLPPDEEGLDSRALGGPVLEVGGAQEEQGRTLQVEEKPPDGYMWFGRRLTRKQLTSRPDHLWPELWTKLGRNAQLKEKQKWSNEQPKLDNAGRLRGIYVIDLEDKEFIESIRIAQKKLETPMAPAMPCKTSKNSQHGATRGKSNEIKSKLACILEASECTRLRMGESLPNYHEDHIAGKGDNSVQHYNLVHKIIPMPQAIKVPAAKAAVDKEWEKLEKKSGVEPDESQK